MTKKLRLRPILIKSSGWAETQSTIIASWELLLSPSKWTDYFLLVTKPNISESRFFSVPKRRVLSSVKLMTNCSRWQTEAGSSYLSRISPTNLRYLSRNLPRMATITCCTISGQYLNFTSALTFVTRSSGNRSSQTTSTASLTKTQRESRSNLFSKICLSRLITTPRMIR